VPRGADLFTLAGSTGPPLMGNPNVLFLDYVRYFLEQDANWDWRSLTPAGFQLLFRQSVEQFGTVFGTENPDLAAFRDRGGKLIIFHGLSDQVVPAAGTIDYYKQVEQKMGGPAKTRRFARLFLVPGVDHGFRGAAPAPTPSDQFAAILRWVEDNQPPDVLMAELRDAEGNVIRTRPLFPYPQVAKYKGSGSIDEAASFVASPSAP